MVKDKPRLARLTAIITQLQSKKIVTARDLAKKHSVSIRTVYRDIRTLEQSGIPILTEEGKGYSIVEGYKLPPVMFTEDEANALITAEQWVLKNKDASFIKAYTEAIAKIKAILRYNIKGKANLLAERVYYAQNETGERTSDHLLSVQFALTNFYQTRITYTDEANNITDRIIEPFALLSTKEKWLLVAWCRLRNTFRFFRLDRINKLAVLPERFEPHNLTLQEYFEQYH